MDKQDVLNKMTSMPLSSPSYPSVPFRFINREFFIIQYRTDAKKIRELLPDPLEPDSSNVVNFEFIYMPDSYGFGSYTEAGIVIPCRYREEDVNFTSQMYLDCHAPIAAGREIWGFPKKLAYPSLDVQGDTLVGKLLYGRELVAMGTMTYKTRDLLDPCSSGDKKIPHSLQKNLEKRQINLRFIPNPSSGVDIAQLVAYEMTNICIKGAWRGEARLHLVPHVNAPVADLPVHEIVGATHFITDLTLPGGQVIFDYKTSTSFTML